MAKAGSGGTLGGEPDLTVQTPIFVGIDGGGTGCRARLADAAGRVLGQGSAGPANLTIGVERAVEAIAAAARAAFSEAGLPESAMAEAPCGIGIAGANSPRHRESLAAAGLPFRSVAVRSDAEVACLGAHGGDGAIVILGTGSHGFLVKDGVGQGIGGWGFLLSDGASGAVVGHRAARRALLAHDGIALGSPFTAAVMARFGDDPAAMLAWALAALPRDWGTLAPLVFSHADRGDPVARALLDEAVAEVAALLDRLIALGAQCIALLGGMAAQYRPRLDRRFDPVIVPPKGDALDGALRLARDHAAAEGRRP